MKQREARQHGERLLGKKRFGQLVEYGQAAQAQGKFAEFVKKTLAELGPLIGPLIVSLIKMLIVA